MALMAVVATGVSVWAVRLVRDTLEINRKATQAALKAADHAAEANAIARQEQRPWVVIERDAPCSFHLHGEDRGECHWRYRLINHGRLPARQTRVTTKLIRYRGSGFGHLNRYRDFVATCRERRLLGGYVVFPDSPIQMDRASIHTVFDDLGDAYALAVCVVYQTPDGFGVDGQLFDISMDKRFPIGPRIHKLIGYSDLRIVE